MPKKDINETAFDVVRRATGEIPEPVESAKAKAGRKGGIKGGVVRATSLTPRERSDIAKKAAAARWRGRENADGSIVPAANKRRSRTRRKDA